MKRAIYKVGIAAIVVLVSAVLLSVLISSGTSYTVMETVEHNPSLPHFVLDDVVLHGETFGNSENPVVIVAHGGPGWDYRSLLPIKALSDEYFVLLYDQRGTGLSPRVDDNELSFESYLADLDALVDRYGGERPVNLIGHSFGGMLVSSYVGQHPDKVAAVILAEPGPLTSEIAKHADLKFTYGVRFALHAIGSWVESRFYSGPDDRAKGDYFLGKYFGSYEGKGHPFDPYFCNQKTPLEGLQHWRLGSGAFNWKVTNSYPSDNAGQRVSHVRGVEEFGKEVLFLAGSCNTALGTEVQRKQMKYFPKARMVVIDGVGHWMFIESPEASLAPVREYLLEHNR